MDRMIGCDKSKPVMRVVGQQYLVAAFIENKALSLIYTDYSTFFCNLQLFG